MTRKGGLILSAWAVWRRAWSLFILIATVIAGFGLVCPRAAVAEDFGANLFRQIFSGSQSPYLDIPEGQEVRVHMTGFLQNETGMWADSSAIRYNKSKNSFATERNWIQLDTTGSIGSHSRFFLRFWGVYEPAYPFERPGVTKHGLTDFYNQYGFHDAWYNYKYGPLSVFLGRQIVTWGESISFRVNDVINPQDTSFAFGFANLEQSRMPVWMLHPIYTLPDFGPFIANDIEGVFVPALQPQYTNVDYPDDRYNGSQDVAGGVNLTAPPGGRFTPRPYPFLFLSSRPGAPSSFFAFPQVVGTLGKNIWRLPRDTWASSNEGFRLHSIIHDIETTAIYWHGHQLGAATQIIGPPGNQHFFFFYPEINDIGVTANKAIYLPQWAPAILQSIPFVLRTEGLWQDRTPFTTNDPTRPSAITYSSTLNTLLALDITSAYVPWLSETGSVSMNFEWQNYTILSPNKHMVYTTYAERWRHNEENLLLNLGTNWWWGAVAPTFTAIYNPDGNTFLLFPNVTLTPTWTDKYFVNLKYIGILGNDKYAAYAGGIFKGKSIFLATFQYNFALF